MSLRSINARRATVDDLDELRNLWHRSGLQVEEMEKHLTEFQLVFSTTGELVGAVALRAFGKHGKLHSEAFIHPEHEEDFRPLLWERVKAVARNHGLVRLWTQEQAPFYHQNGFRDADAETLKKLPADFGDRHGNWMSLQLRDELVLSLDKEFEVFRQAEVESTERVMQQARLLKLIAIIVAVALFLVVAVGLLYLMRQNQLPPTR